MFLLILLKDDFEVNFLLFPEANRGRISLLRCEDWRAAAELLSVPLLAPRVHPGEGHRRRGQGQTGGKANLGHFLNLARGCQEAKKSLATPMYLLGSLLIG